MTQRDPSEFNPKHRVLGAIVVVSLAVIFVPMILDRRDAPADGNTPPPAQTGATKVVVTPVRPEPRQETPKAETATVAPPAPASLTTPAPGAKPAAKPADAKPSEPKPGWAVQVGTFSNTANAARIEEQLKKNGHAVKVERVAFNGGNAVRIRVGPFRDKALATKAQGQIQKQTGVAGAVVSYP